MKFEIEKEEEVLKWLSNHECQFCHAENVGAIGGRLTYCFTPTGLGVICKIKCECGEEFDATDYESW